MNCRRCGDEAIMCDKIFEHSKFRDKMITGFFYLCPMCGYRFKDDR